VGGMVDQRARSSLHGDVDGFAWYSSGNGVHVVRKRHVPAHQFQTQGGHHLPSRRPLCTHLTTATSTQSVARKDARALRVLFKPQCRTLKRFMEHSKQEKSRGSINNVDGYLSTPQAFIAHVSIDVLATRDAGDSSFHIDTGATQHLVADRSDEDKATLPPIRGAKVYRRNAVVAARYNLIESAWKDDHGLVRTDDRLANSYTAFDTYLWVHDAIGVS